MNNLFEKQISGLNKENDLITFSTSFYILKSKFPANTYLKWIKNMLSIIQNCNLVIYTDGETLKSLIPLIDPTNKKIKLILKEKSNFYTYKYRDYWIKNHAQSDMILHKETDWELNMLWNEKVFFVNETIQMQYFSSLYYGWCDIGYFRNRINDLHTKYLGNWPNPIKFANQPFKNTYIHYGCVQNNSLIFDELKNEITRHYKEKLESPPSEKYKEICFAGGFYILKPELSSNYVKLYELKLQYYFENNYFIKDDQTIVMDIIFTNPSMFCIHKENDKRFDNWFMFQRLLW